MKRAAISRLRLLSLAASSLLSPSFFPPPPPSVSLSVQMRPGDGAETVARGESSARVCAAAMYEWIRPSEKQTHNSAVFCLLPLLVVSADSEHRMQAHRRILGGRTSNGEIEALAFVSCSRVECEADETAEPRSAGAVIAAVPVIADCCSTIFAISLPRRRRRCRCPPLGSLRPPLFADACAFRRN